MGDCHCPLPAQDRGWGWGWGRRYPPSTRTLSMCQRPVSSIIPFWKMVSPWGRLHHPGRVRTSESATWYSAPNSQSQQWQTNKLTAFGPALANGKHVRTETWNSGQIELLEGGDRLLRSSSCASPFCVLANVQCQELRVNGIAIKTSIAQRKDVRWWPQKGPVQDVGMPECRDAGMPMLGRQRELAWQIRLWQRQLNSSKFILKRDGSVTHDESYFFKINSRDILWSKKYFRSFYSLYILFNIFFIYF